MEIVMIILAGILVAAAVYLILSRSLLRVIIGTSILTHAVNLLLLSMGGLKEGAIPIYGKEIKRYVDPIPQALILTAIVISFAITAFILVLAFRSYKELGTDNLEEMRGVPDEQ
ncbi:Na(+)/H(+) antiporter subunit C [Macrococcus brunensis]|uniref:Na(+)/H(+) antiporter subunit C n=1 Tax=Macrococcus brunensis TaxID=198483 RepID=UPI001EF1040F|nr:Na(+)/H(+) antiporter subunit C [Macrococcus brunensis]ULG72610.1 Na(+)/H(+) antiporter subunit C [Macrococcus brunensis]ULG74864.1 Na(+)/H(+) antiporter subunit C [Macrococcus brunensis]